MRTNRILRQMAGVEPTAYDKRVRRASRHMQRLNRVFMQELLLLDLVQRRQRGDEGTRPMPLAQMRTDLEKIRKGEL